MTDWTPNDRWLIFGRSIWGRFQSIDAVSEVWATGDVVSLPKAEAPNYLDFRPESYEETRAALVRHTILKRTNVRLRTNDRCYAQATNDIVADARMVMVRAGVRRLGAQCFEVPFELWQAISPTFFLDTAIPSLVYMDASIWCYEDRPDGNDRLTPQEMGGVPIF